MDQEILMLYTELTQEERDKVDFRIRELFTKRRELLAVGDCPNIQRQENP